MRNKRSQNSNVTFLMFCCCLFLFACQAEPNETDEQNDLPEEEETYSLTPIDIQYESFQKVIGWLSEETLLVHTGTTESHELVAYHIFSGEKNPIYSEDSFLLSVEISQARDKIVIQEVGDDFSQLKVISVTGETIESIAFDYTSYATIDWNPTNDETLFVSHYNFDHVLESEVIQVYIWSIDDNSLTAKDIPSLTPKWYSANVYLYVDELETNALYIGDIREDQEDLMINRDIVDFYLNMDTFLGIVESDIQDNVLHVFHEYPFLVGEKVISIPKVTSNGYPVRPPLTQSARNGDIYGVLPDYSFSLDEELGEYHLARLDFETETTEEIMALPQEAPIELSPTEEYLLYGWRFENIIDLTSLEMIPLIEEMN